MGARACHVTVITHPLATRDVSATVLPWQRRWGTLAMPMLIERIRRTTPNVVVVQYVPQMYGYRGLTIGIALAVAVLRALGFVVVTMAHELYFPRTAPLRLRLIGVVQRIGIVLLAWGSSALVVTTSDRLERLRRIFPLWPNKFYLIPVGSTLLVSPSPEPRTWRRSMGIPDTATLLVFQALDPSRETIQMLGDVLDRTSINQLDVRLVIVGPGTVHHDRCINVGYVSYIDGSLVAQILASCDIAILPFDGGASGRRTTLINALAMGLPVITNTGRNTDIALLGSAVRLLHDQGAASISSAILDLVGQPEAREKLANSARELYAREFSWAILVDRWLRVFDDVMKSRSLDSSEAAAKTPGSGS
jgi:glycosyltransferase involved in cell wall biosynthesis